jgi:hypothetical protein
MSKLDEARSTDVTFKNCSRDSDKADLVADLVGVARAVQLILWHLSKRIPENGDFDTIASGLSMALRYVVDPTDAYFFSSLGDLNNEIPKAHLALLLESELEKVRAQMATERAR